MYAAKSLSAFCLHLFDCGERLDCGEKKRFGNHVLCQDEYLYARRNHNRKPQQCDLSLIRMRRL